MSSTKRGDRVARRSLDSLRRSEPSFKFSVSYVPDTRTESSSTVKSTRAKRLSLDSLTVSSNTAAERDNTTISPSSKVKNSTILPILLEDLSAEQNTPGTSSAHNTHRDDFIAHSSSTKKPSKTSIFHRLSLGGGVIIAGSLAQDAIEGLGLQQQELRILRSSFDKIDEDKNGAIDKLELLHALGETDAKGILNNSFTDKVYQMIDMDRNENIGFDEFVRMSATFLMFTHRDMVRFVFGCYNKAGQGMFGLQDFADLTKVINTVTLNGGPRTWVDVLKFDKEYKGYLSEAEFIEMANQYPQLIYFASRLQARLQSISLGDKFYSKMLERQEKARILQEYKNIHNGELPPEKFSMTAWMRKIASHGESDVDRDIRKGDINTHLLDLGFNMYIKLAETYSKKKK